MENEWAYKITTLSPYHSSNKHGDDGGRSGSGKVCWLYGGASEIYLTNGITNYPHSVDLIDKVFSNGYLPPKEALREELCLEDTRRLQATPSYVGVCAHPCTNVYEVSIDESTCFCYEGLDPDYPDPYAVNTQGKTLSSCLRLCWQNYGYNRFTSDAAAETCDSECVLNCASLRFDGKKPYDAP
eukprot:Platyproteum_vivax@DN4076_c0_g1_i5.p2